MLELVRPMLKQRRKLVRLKLPAKTDATTAYFDSQVQRFSDHYSYKPCFKDRLSLFVDGIRASVPLPARVLDFGCGPGTISLKLAHLGYEVTGLDGSSDMIHLARLSKNGCHLPNISFDQISSTRLQLPSRSFDAVICSSVLEYIEDDWGLLEKLVESLKPEGYLAISIPHTHSIFGKLEDLAFSAGWFSRGERSGHLNYSLRRYSKCAFIESLQGMGMDVSFCTTFDFPLLGYAGVCLSRCRLFGAMLLVTGYKQS